MFHPLPPFRLVVPVLLCLLFAPSFSHAATPPHRTAHVVVALCDNINQGIVPVPLKLGDGNDPNGNLYWGAAFGVKTFMRKQAGWKLVKTETAPGPHILERIYCRNEKLNVTMVADAYKGAAIKDATIALLTYASGRDVQELRLEGKTITAGGGAALAVYVGHNGLMDFSLPELLPGTGVKTGAPRQAAIFACQSKAYFANVLKISGAHPLIWTRGNMAPEAYSLHALVTAWAEGKSPEAVREAVARAYDRYQKCGIKGARGLFATGW